MGIALNKKHLFGICVISLVLISLITWGLYLENTSIVVTEFDLYCSDLPAQFEGYRLIQISDFHSGSAGPDAGKVLARVSAIQADAVVLTGDFFDQKNISLAPQGLTLLDGLKSSVPVYFILGNHEWMKGQWLAFEEEVQKRGTFILRNHSVEIAREGKLIHLIGLDDPVFFSNSGTNPAEELEKLFTGIPEEHFTILLAHRPELIQLYQQAGADLVLSGHAHGGQIRLPWSGGLIAPGQGFFPRYSEGVHVEGSTTMVISRGLGNSVIPQRLFNRPEIVLITLHSQ